MIYLDHAATTPIPKAVADTMYEVLLNQFANPSAQYQAGLDMNRQIERWRESIAAALDGDAERLYFTSCGTEGDNWAVSAACWHNRRMGKHIVTSAVEHSAILEACKRMEEAGYSVTRVAPDRDGAVSAQAVLDAVTPETALVSVMLVNNELGNRYPVEEIARGLRAKNPGALLHTDAVQGFLKVPFSARTLGADLITLSAHKIGGPKGIGALYIGPRLKRPRPWLPGGGQERGLRSGTEATAQIAGFAKAVELRRAALPETLSHLERLRAYAIQRLTEIPDCIIIGGASKNVPGHSTAGSAAADGAVYAPHILAAALDGWPGQNVVRDLSAQGICVSAGSACHKGKPSHVIAALRLPKRTEKSVIRLSFGPETTEAEIDALACALRRHHDERFPML